MSQILVLVVVIMHFFVHEDFCDAILRSQGNAKHPRSRKRGRGGGIRGGISGNQEERGNEIHGKRRNKRKKIRKRVYKQTINHQENDLV